MKKSTAHPNRPPRNLHERRGPTDGREPKKLLLILDSFHGSLNSIAWILNNPVKIQVITVLVRRDVLTWLPEKLLANLLGGFDRVNVVPTPSWLRVSSRFVSIGELWKGRNGYRRELLTLEEFLFNLLPDTEGPWFVVGGNSPFLSVVDNLCRKKNIVRFSHGLSDELSNLSLLQRALWPTKQMARALILGRHFLGLSVRPISPFRPKKSTVDAISTYRGILEEVSSNVAREYPSLAIFPCDVFILIPEGATNARQAAKMVLKILGEVPKSTSLWRQRERISIVVKQHPRMAAEFSITVDDLADSIRKASKFDGLRRDFSVVDSSLPAELAIAIARPALVVGTVSTALYLSTFLFKDCDVMLVKVNKIETIYKEIETDTKIEIEKWQTKLSNVFEDSKSSTTRVKDMRL